MIILILILLGLCLGSFVNALVWRLHKQATVRSKKQRAIYSIAHGRSMCTHCGHQLAVQDLIPVLSWLSLRGKCRYCGKPIPDTPLAELLVPLLFILSFVFWPESFDSEQIVLFGFWLTYLVLFVALCLYDIRWQLLPNKLVAIVGGLAAVQVLVQLVLFSMTFMNLAWAFAAALVGGGIFWVIFQLSGGKWIGGGDVKLGFVLGLILGKPSLAFLYIFIASLVGTIVAAPSLLSKRLSFTAKLPFGPYLMAGAFITFLFGQMMIDWYLGVAGL